MIAADENRPEVSLPSSRGRAGAQNQGAARLRPICPKDSTTTTPSLDPRPVRFYFQQTLGLVIALRVLFRGERGDLVPPRFSGWRRAGPTGEDQPRASRAAAVADGQAALCSAVERSHDRTHADFELLQLVSQSSALTAAISGLFLTRSAEAFRCGRSRRCGRHCMIAIQRPGPADFTEEARQASFPISWPHC